MEQRTWEKWTEDLNSIPITEVCNILGIEVRKNEILCPSHNDRHYGSCKLNIKSNFYYCFSCGASGNPIKLVQEVRNCTFISACNFLAEQFGFPSYNELNRGTKSNKKAKIMPLSNYEIELLGLQNYIHIEKLEKVNSIFSEDSVVIRDNDGNIIGAGHKIAEQYSLRSLFYDSPTVFKVVVQSKIRERQKQLKQLYASEIWKRKELIKIPFLADSILMGMEKMEEIAEKIELIK